MILPIPSTYHTSEVWIRSFEEVAEIGAADAETLTECTYMLTKVAF